MTDESFEDFLSTSGLTAEQIVEAAKALATGGKQAQTPVRRIAPDGGPVSNAHLFLKTSLCKLVRVTHEAADGSGAVESLIRAADFDSAIHTLVEKDDAGTVEQAQAKAKAKARRRRRRAVDEDDE